LIFYSRPQYFLPRQNNTSLSLCEIVGLMAWKVLFAARVRVTVGTSGISRELKSQTSEMKFHIKNWTSSWRMATLISAIRIQKLPDTVAIFKRIIFMGYSRGFNLFVKLQNYIESVTKFLHQRTTRKGINIHLDSDSLVNI
jgi:hypothetical protein